MTRQQWIVIGVLAICVTTVYFALCSTIAGPLFRQDLAGNQAAESEPAISQLSSSSPMPPLSLGSALQLTPRLTVKPTAQPVPAVTRVQNPVYLLSDYLQNVSYPHVGEARPWTNNSVNVWQYSQQLGGVTFWDYFASKFGQGFEEDWNSARYGWLNDKGEWQTYRTEIIKDTKGQDVVSYVIVDRSGAGAVDKMVFTQYSVGARPSDSNPDLSEWGYLSHLGRIRIQVDDKVAYDVSIEDWFSGKAVCLPSDLAKLFFWRYHDFGSNGSILPIPYQRRIKISVYGGIEKPKWFAFTGVTLPEGTAVKPISGCLDPATRDSVRSLSPNVTNPESYLDRLGQTGETQDLWPRITGKSVADTPSQSNDPRSRIEFVGKGTVAALQFRVPKNYDMAALYLKITYGKEVGIDMPFMAFFSDQDRIVKHRSTPIGVVDDPKDSNSYLFYCNYPLPYQNGLVIELTTRSQPVNIRTRYARSAEVTNTLFRAVFDDFRSHPLLQPLGPDYTVTLAGNGKLVGVVLAARDYRFDPKTIPGPPPDLVHGTGVFPMGYMESNVTLKDGRGVVRIYSGLEDFADGGYDFDSDKGPGAKNLPFAGVLAFSWLPQETGYFTLFRYFNDLSAFRFNKGLTLSFQHGTWKNNFSLRYGLTAFYYSEIP